MQLIAQGAEARVYLDGESVIKERSPKGYRHPEIDSGLRRFRTRREAKVLAVLSKEGFPSPRVLDVDDSAGRLSIEKIDGEKLRDIIKDDPHKFGREIGSLLGALHNIGIIHGDPTTSNMIVRAGKIHLIDFGLSQFSQKIEDKAVDLHLLDRAVESAHHLIHSSVMAMAAEAYLKTAKDGKQVLDRLERVKNRGRNKLKGS